MTPETAIKIVEEKTMGRTRHSGQDPFYDEVLVEEIKRLRFENHRLKLMVRKFFFNWIEFVGPESKGQDK